MQIVNPHFLRENKGHYVPGMIAGGLLFISGQLSIDPDTGVVPKGGADVHARLALNGMDRVLKEVGLTKGDVAFCQVYVVGVENWDAVNKEYAAYFGDHKPARVITPVNSLHFGCLVEISAVAEMPKK